MWTAEDAKRFLDALADDRLVPLWTLALHTGLRRGELAGLRWSDVDLDEGTLTVAQQRTSANYVTVVTAPKAKSHRQLLLAPATVAALKAHLNRQRQERLALGPDWTDSGYVFVDELGVEYHPQRFTKMFDDAIRSVGVVPQDPPPRHAPHDGDAGAGGGRPPEGRAGAARPLLDRRHDGHLLPRPPGREARQR